MQYDIKRKIKGSRTFFYAEVQGIRIGKTNWARRYDAESEMRRVFEALGEAKILALVNAKKMQNA